ncbi:MAG: OmpA family protein [Bacteroidaceae bacterium]|nr:OmpA family protein [Bacteroidaceae bacterium]
MNIKKALLSCALLVAGVAANAQWEPKTVYDFQPHWYVQLQPVGGQYTLGEVSFKHLISYNVQGALGYDFTPVFGARLAVNGWTSKAGTEVDGGDNAQWKWTYFSPTLDLTINLSNALFGFNPNRVFNLGVFVGAGANFAGSNHRAVRANNYLASLHNYANGYQPLQYLWNGTKTRFVGQTGLQADFRLSERLALNLEAQANILNDKYNSKRSGNADWYFIAYAGLKINLGKTYTTRVITPPAPPEKVIERVVEKVVEKPVPAPAPAPKQEVKKEKIRRDVYFTIGSTVIRSAEMEKVKEIAEFLKSHPDANLTITGYADKGTGNAAINARLAARRAEAVTNALKNKYGISGSRIVYDSKGDTVQPFTVNNENRVSICIAE